MFEINCVHFAPKKTNNSPRLFIIGRIYEKGLRKDGDLFEKILGLDGCF